MAKFHKNIDNVLPSDGTIFCLTAQGEEAIKNSESLKNTAAFMSQLGFRCWFVYGSVTDKAEKTLPGFLFFAENTAGYVNEAFFLKFFIAVARAANLDFLLYRTFGHLNKDEQAKRRNNLYQLFQVQMDDSWLNMDVKLELLEESSNGKRKLKTLLRHIRSLNDDHWRLDGREWQPAELPLLMGAEAQLSSLAFCLRQFGLQNILAKLGFATNDTYFRDQPEKLKPLVENVPLADSAAALEDVFRNSDRIYTICAQNAPESVVNCLSDLLSAVGLEVSCGEYKSASPGDILPQGTYFLATIAWEHIPEEFYWRFLIACKALFQLSFMGAFAGNPFVADDFTIQKKTAPIPEMAGLGVWREISDSLYSKDIADFAAFVASKKCPGLDAENLIAKISPAQRHLASPAQISPVADDEFVVYCFPINGPSSPSTPAPVLGSYGNYPGYDAIPTDENGKPTREIIFGADAWRTTPDGKREQGRLEFSQVFDMGLSPDASRYLAYEFGKLLGLDFVMFQTKSGKVGRIFTNPKTGRVGREDSLKKNLMSDAREWADVLGRLAGGVWQVAAHPLLGSYRPPVGIWSRIRRGEISGAFHRGMEVAARMIGKEYMPDNYEFIYEGEVNPLAIYRQMAANRQFAEFFASGEPFYCTVVAESATNANRKLSFLRSLLHRAGLVFLEAKSAEGDIYIFARNLLYWRGEESLWKLLCRCEKFLELKFIAKLSSFASADFEPLALTLPALGYDGALLRDDIFPDHDELFNLDKFPEYEASRIDYRAPMLGSGD